jgi:hypothetical protein
MCAKKKSGSALSKTTTATVSLDSMRENRASSSLIITLSIRFSGSAHQPAQQQRLDVIERTRRGGFAHLVAQIRADSHVIEVAGRARLIVYFELG